MSSYLAALAGAKGTFAEAVLPCRTGPVRSDDDVMSGRDPTIGMRVVAAVPLLQAALERAVTAAGMRAVPPGEAAAATLRTRDQPATGAPIDISVDVGHVTIVLTESPSPEFWAATLNLLRHLLDGT